MPPLANPAHVVSECLTRDGGAGAAELIRTGSPNAQRPMIAFGRRREIRRVRNLSNAVKYNRAGGEVRIEVNRIGPERVCIVVSDTGLGMSREQLQFRPFSRLPQYASGFKGTGIGLAITKHLVELMGGAAPASRVNADAAAASGWTCPWRARRLKQPRQAG